MIKRYCDRCGKEMCQWQYHVMITNMQDEDAYDIVYDLCDSCMDHLIGMIEENQ